ncbi:MAG: GTPase [Thermoguttaceae bacterium]|jgi:hypothetical protein|nr:GTPase [Thermoguttaceae bacterium]
MTRFETFADDLRNLDRALHSLAPAAAAVGVAPPAGQEWYELLRRRLLPQLELPPVLIAAVVGGTNIGKSVLFNHLAGEVASAVSPLAAGTKHPVCLAPPGLDDPELLGRLFQAFQLHRWTSPDEALEESPEDRLFWRTGPQMPERLLLLDAPDVDSDAEVNWQRARAIRQSADVLLAVLTQQKYNDAAVKQFFRAAVEADKPVVVLFNQVDLEADAAYWPAWLATFCRETGAEPELVYAIPHDRRAAEELRLPFFAIGPDGSRPLGEPADLREELAALHFDAVKVRTFRGALRRILDPEHGVGGYLHRLRMASGDYEASARALQASELARLAWPTLPAGVLVDEIRRWWHSTRRPWSKRIHAFYRTLGRGLTWPVQAARNAVAGPAPDPLETFKGREREAILAGVRDMYDQLQRLASAGNDTLRPRLQKLLAGSSRADLLKRVTAAHDQLPAVDDDYRTFLRTELDAWREANPKAVLMLQSLDQAWALARPTITVALVVSSWGVADVLVGQAGHLAGELATELAVTGGLTGGGEAIVSGTTEGVGKAAARLFSRLQSQYAKKRAAWLAGWLADELLGGLLHELQRGAAVTDDAAFSQVVACSGRLLAALTPVADH